MGSSFAELRLRHLDLVQKAQNPAAEADILAKARKLLEELRLSGKETPAAEDRQRLESYAAYWGDYIFRKTGSYPSTAIYPSQKPRETPVTLTPGEGSAAPVGPEEVKESPQETNAGCARVNLLIIVGIAGVVLLAFVVFAVLAGILPGLLRTPTPTIPMVAPQDTQEPPETSTMAAAGPHDTSTPVLTPPATAAPIVQVSTQTPAPPTLSFAITNPQNGVFIEPQLELSGTYQNLPAGWSIHVFLQSLSAGKTIFPLPAYFVIPQGESSGYWKISADLGKLYGNLNEADTYVITLGLVNSEQIRAELVQAGKSGLTRMPAEVLWQQDRPVTVNRKAFRYVDEIRLVYSGWNAKEAQFDLFSARPEDGKDPIQLVHTPEISEIMPRLSPDGKLIAYVGREDIYNSRDKRYSLWVTTSDGQNRTLLLQQKGTEYSTPAWSPDGRSLAFVALVQGAKEADRKIFIIKNLPAVLVSSEVNQVRPLVIKVDGSAWSPIWISPDEIDFLHDNNGKRSLDKYFPASNKLGQQSGVPGNPLELSIGPNNQIAFSGTDANLYLFSPVAGKILPVVAGSENDILPYWDPGGKKLYFASDRLDGNYSIWSIDLETKVQQQIVPPTSSYPTIGQFLAYIPVER